MDKNLFMDLMHVAWDDYRAYDHTIEGMLIVTVKKNRNDDLAVQMGSTITPEVVEYVLDMLARRIADAPLVAMPPRNMIRKAV